MGDQIAKFSVATIWDDELLVGLAQLNDSLAAKHNSQVYEVFGSFPLSVTGSGRPPTTVPALSLEGAKRHIELAHSLGIRFNYVLNSPCMGNEEFDPDSFERFLQTMSLLVDLGVDVVTLANPFLIEAVHNRFPELPIVTSLMCYIDTPSKARAFERLGIQRIAVDQDHNREFDCLRGIRNSVECDLEIYVNVSCVLHCPFRKYHMAISGHASQDIKSPHGSFYPEYPMLKCTTILVEDATEFIKAPWVRPEDVQVYLDRGYEFFKIGGRSTRRPNRLVEVAKAYMTRHYEGCVWDLVGKPLNVFDNLHPSLVSEQLPAPKVSVPNQALDGFIDFFLERRDTCHMDCRECGYCERVAAKVVVVNEEEAAHFVEHNHCTSHALTTMDYRQAAYRQALERWREKVEDKRAVV